MLGVQMEFVLVYQNIREIHTLDADQNVYLTLIVQEIRLVSVTNVKLLVQVLVDKMQDAMSSTTYLCVVVQQECLEILSLTAGQWKVLFCLNPTLKRNNFKFN